MDSEAKQITTLLQRARDDAAVQSELFQLVEARFRRTAKRLFRQERPDHTLQGTVLVDDAFQKLVISSPTLWENREQFFAAAAKVMRQLLVDYARKKNAARRGGGEATLPYDSQAVSVPGTASTPIEVLSVAEAVERLEKLHPESFKIFNLHYFMGWELREIAEDVLELSYTTVKRRWGMAKAFLHNELVD